MDEHDFLAEQFEENRTHLRVVARQALSYSQLGLFVRPALVNGAAGLVTTRDGKPFSVGGFTVRGGKIVEIDILADPPRLAELDLTILED